MLTNGDNVNKSLTKKILEMVTNANQCWQTLTFVKKCQQMLATKKEMRAPKRNWISHLSSDTC